MQTETPLWTGSPSQWMNLGRYLLCILGCWLIVPLGLMAWWWLELKYTQYELTSERLRTRTGVLNRKTEDLELYRVRDYRIEQPLFLRLFGLSNVILDTVDRSNPQIVLFAITEAEPLVDMLRARVEKLRASRGVREVDFQ